MIYAEYPGILALIGDTGGAYFTGAIAVHTFNTLVLRNKLSRWFCAGVNLFGWLTAILVGRCSFQPLTLLVAHACV